MDLIDAVRKKDAKLVKELLEQGINPNETDDWANVTPLHYAVLNDSLEIASLLLAAGANINARDRIDQETPLDIAKMQENKEMIKLLTRIPSSK